jgi:hypothetical protein
MMTAQAMGQGPSMAQGQLAQATNRNIAQQQAMAAGGRGGASPLAAMQAARNVSAMGQQAAGDSALLRQREMMDARGMLGQALTGFRGQDIDVASQNLAAQNFARQHNQMAAFGQKQLAEGILGKRLGIQGPSAGIMAAGLQMLGDGSGLAGALKK